MKIGTEDKKKLGVAIGAGVLAIGAAFYLYSELATPDVPPPVAASQPVVVNGPAAAANSQAGATGSRTAKNVGTAALDPTLKMGPMLVTESLVYSGSGRNIFSANSVQAAIPKPIASVRPKAIAAQYVAPVPTGPPGPPPIDLKFFGTATSANGNRQAFLLRGEDVFLASPGDIVQRRYRVIAVRANSIEVEDMANSNTQTLPLLVN